MDWEEALSAKIIQFWIQSIDFGSVNLDTRNCIGNICNGSTVFRTRYGRGLR